MKTILSNDAPTAVSLENHSVQKCGKNMRFEGENAIRQYFVCECGNRMNYPRAFYENGDVPICEAKITHKGTPRGIDYWASLELALDALERNAKSNANRNLARLAIGYANKLKGGNRAS